MISPIRKVVSFISAPKVNLVPNFVKNSPRMQNWANKFGMESTSYLQTLAISSIVLKDALGCYLYVKQSLNNKNIPEDKRAFVAALDLTNGGLMIVMQLLMFFSISNPKFQKKLFNKLFGQHFDKVSRKIYATWVRAFSKDPTIPKSEIYNSVDSVMDGTQKIFNTVTSLVAASTIGKRVIVPFIATPLATYVKDKYLSKPPADKNKQTIKA